MIPAHPLPNYKEHAISTGKHRKYDDFSYTKVKFIAKGSHKVCWEAKFESGKKAVLKQFFQDKDFKELLHYLKVIDTLKGHPAIAVTESTFWTKWYAGYKFFQIQTLYTCDLLTAVNNDLFLHNRVLVLIALRQLAEGLFYIHGKGVVVKDVKLDNIYLTYSLRDAQFVYGDFGGADLPRERSSLKTASLHYASPQRLNGEISTASDDVYSLGICFAAIQKTSRFFRFPVTIAKQDRTNMYDAGNTFIREIVLPKYRPIITSMLLVTRMHRSSAKEVNKKVHELKTHLTMAEDVNGKVREIIHKRSHSF